MKRSDTRRTDANQMLEPWVELRRAWVIAARGNSPARAWQARHAAGLARTAGQYAVEAEALTMLLASATPWRRYRGLAS